MREPLNSELRMRQRSLLSTVGLGAAAGRIYCNSCLPVMASVSIFPLAYSIVLPVARPLAKRVILTPVDLSRELM
jgi:hypothetical protein